MPARPSRVPPRLPDRRAGGRRHPRRPGPEAIAFGMGRPYESSRRVVRISRAELAGVEAANALLKSLEEPGSRLHWILTTTRRESLLPTVLSRCLAVAVPAPSRDDRPRPGGRAASIPRRRRTSRSTRRRERGRGPGSARGDAPLPLRFARGAPRRSREREARSPPPAGGASSAAPRTRRSRSWAACSRMGHSSPPGFRPSSSATAPSPVALREIGRRAGRVALERAALAAADVPADTRRGNRRLHFEKAFLELWLAGEPGGLPRLRSGTGTRKYRAPGKKSKEHRGGAPIPTGSEGFGKSADLGATETGRRWGQPP